MNEQKPRPHHVESMPGGLGWRVVHVDTGEVIADRLQLGPAMEMAGDGCRVDGTWSIPRNRLTLDAPPSVREGAARPPGPTALGRPRAGGQNSGHKLIPNRSCFWPARRLLLCPSA